MASIPDARAFGNELERAFTEENHQRAAASARRPSGSTAPAPCRMRSDRWSMPPWRTPCSRSVVPRARLHRFVGAELGAALPRDRDRRPLPRRGAHPQDDRDASGPLEHAVRGCSRRPCSVGAAMYETNTEIRNGTGIGTPDQLVRAAMYALAAARATATA
jgi:hypothetical protein